MKKLLTITILMMILGITKLFPAPAPRPRPTTIQPGFFVGQWGNMPFLIQLKKDGTCISYPFGGMGAKFYGKWIYNKPTLSVTEHSVIFNKQIGMTYSWYVNLSDKLEGKANGIEISNMLQKQNEIKDIAFKLRRATEDDTRGITE